MTARAGYSVMEVLIAFTVMATVLAVLIPGQSSLLVGARQAEQSLLAMEYAASRLDQIGVSEPLEEGNAVYRDWHVTWRIEPRQEIEDSLVVVELIVEVTDTMSGDLLASLSSLRLAE